MQVYRSQSSSIKERFIANGYLGAAFDGQVAEGKLTMREMWNKAWDVNTTGTHILTHTFIPLLLKSSDPRLLFITSGTATLTDSANTSVGINISPPKGWPKQGISLAAYRSSKTGMNMMMRDWVRTLKEDGVKIWAISPGFLATNLGGSQERNKKMGAGDPALGGTFIRDVVEGARDADVGMVVRRGGIQPW
jgi:NAD(P)-dependent dehydrogenase (short-subunit alcohol dehydrogenase family)